MIDVDVVQQPAVFYAEKRINERCHGDGMHVAYASNVTRPRHAIQHRESWYKQMLKPLVLVK